jgi:hypothetical protein
MARRKKKRHPGTLKLRSRTYWLRLCVGGAYRYFTVPTDELRVAEEFAIQKHKELSRQLVRRGQGLPSSITCCQLFERFERQDLPPLAKGDAGRLPRFAEDAPRLLRHRTR